MNKEVAIWIIIALSMTIGIWSTYHLGDDNVVEEISEQIIKEESGIEIDLSPNTPER